MINREKLLTDLDNVHDFLRSIDDPCADSVAMAAAILSGAGTIRTAARLLTLEEVRGWEGFLWFEPVDTFEIPSDDPRVTKAVVDGCVDGIFFLYLHPENTLFSGQAIKYGELWRCWASRPSADEMAAVPWDED